MTHYFSKYGYYIIFLGHAVLLALTMSMIDFNTVFPALIDQLSDSKLLFGSLYSIMLGVPLLFNLLFSYIMRRDPYKKKYLIVGITLRAFAFLGIAVFVYFFSDHYRNIVIYSLFFWIFIFSISGGFAGIAYLDIVGKVFSREQRINFFTFKQLLSSLAALAGGFLVKKVFDLKGLSFPLNYSILLLIAFLGLFLASLLFWFIKEEPSMVKGDEETLKSFLNAIPSILKLDKRFTTFILIENMTSLSLMILPFYMVYAKETFHIDNSYIGKYLLFQIAGTILSNFFWGRINRKRGSGVVVQICIFLGALIPILALLLGNVGPNLYAIIFFFVGFLISGRKIGFDPYLLEISPDEERTTYIGIHGTFSMFIAISPLLGGTFIEVAGYSFTFLFVSLIMIAANILFRKKQ